MNMFAYNVAKSLFFIFLKCYIKEYCFDIAEF